MFFLRTRKLFKESRDRMIEIEYEFKRNNNKLFFESLINQIKIKDDTKKDIHNLA